MNAPIDTKTCTKCRQTLPVEAFYMHRGRRRSACKACFTAQVRARRQTAEGREVCRKGIARRRRTSAWQAWLDHAHQVVAGEVRAGRLPPVSEATCCRAGPDCKGSLSYHHPAYFAHRLADVVPLCDHHHKQAHAEAKPPRPSEAELDAWFAERMAKRGRPLRTGKKRCSRCEEMRPREEFSTNTDTRDGLGVYCRGCRRDYQRRYREMQKIREERRAQRHV